MSEERALTWSKKWHIINPDHPDTAGRPASRSAVARCGAYVYRNDDPHYPPHLQAIRDGRNKDTGLCKICANFANVTTVTVELLEMSAETARDVANSVGMEHNLPALQEYGQLMITAYEVLCGKVVR